MHQHHAGHSHDTAGSRPLKIALAIVLVVMLAEIAGGIISGSVALIGDAGHMLVDALALSLSLFAITIARRPASASRTYGCHKSQRVAEIVLHVDNHDGRMSRRYFPIKRGKYFRFYHLILFVIVICNYLSAQQLTNGSSFMVSSPGGPSATRWAQFTTIDAVPMSP